MHNRVFHGKPPAKQGGAHLQVFAGDALEGGHGISSLQHPVAIKCALHAAASACHLGSSLWGHAGIKIVTSRHIACACRCADFANLHMKLGNECINGWHKGRQRCHHASWRQ